MKVNSDEITKKALVEKYGLELSKKDIEIKELNREILSLEKKVKELNRGLSIYSTDDEIVKKILELRSKSFSPSLIQEKLKFIGVDQDIEVIKDIVYNIDALQLDMTQYYEECVNSYNERVKLNPEILKQASVDRNQRNIDLAQEMLERAINENLDQKVIKDWADKVDQYGKTLDALLKDVLVGDNTKDGSLHILDDVMDEYRENSSRLIKLSIDKNDIQTLNNVN